MNSKRFASEHNTPEPSIDGDKSVTAAVKKAVVGKQAGKRP